MSKKQNVVIAGAGPVGCVAALILARAGVPVTLLEAERQLPADMRASTFHPPTLDMLDELEVTPRLIEQGLITPMFQFRDREEGLIVELDLALVAEHTDHPYRLQCEQFKLTRVIAEMLELHPHAELIFGARVTNISQTDSTVTIGYDSDHGRCTIEGSYAIGCEGSRSAVRKSLGIGFPGFTYPEQFLVVSTIDDLREYVPDMSDVAYISDPDEWCAVIHAPDMWRLLYPTKPGTPAREILGDEYLQQRIRAVSGTSLDHTISHRTLYDVNQRVAETYRSGRILLAGDAAHVNNPLGGMGMNGGIHDGVSAAEKLVEVINAGADTDLLDQYDRQRRPIAVEYVQAHSIRNKRVMEERDPLVRKKRQDELRALADDPVASKALLMQTSMLNSIRKSATTQ
jgi:2-polyprenyl-6-methoxyphenol hydroxylase-like FAD-dependent oxidoreductase